MKGKLLSFITGAFFTIILTVVMLFVFTIYLDMKEFRSFVLFGDFFKVYEFTADETGFDFNIRPLNLLPIGIIGGFISIGLTMFLKRFITIK